MIYITGDTHGMLDGGKLFRQPHIKKEDYLIVCGDFGFIWSTNPNDMDELSNLKKLQKLPYTLLFIDGNHENFDRLFSNEFETVDMFGSKVKQISDNIFYLQRGERYTIEGESFLTIGGAASIDKWLRTEYISWWPQELLSKSEEDEILDLVEQNNTFDYIISHAAPKPIVEMLFGETNDPKEQDPVAAFLEHLLPRLSFKKWFCGHYHVDTAYRIGNGHIRLLYNNVLELN